MDIEHLRTWIGRVERAAQTASPEPIAGLAALLDHDSPPWRDAEVPPLGHWLYFLPHARRSLIGADGHPQRGDFLPPVDLPRRMWAGGRLRYHAPVRLGSSIDRVSTIEDVVAKTGSTGAMVFVTVRHAIHADGALAIEEWQDLVYRGHPAASAPAPAPAVAPRDAEAPRRADATHAITADPVSLFRYSALTFNGHRIHYDRDYARDVEGYAGLVVHGPYAATLLIDLFLRETPGARVTGFAFRARKPLLDTAPFTLNLTHGDGISESWTAGADGEAAMTASIKWER